MISSGFNFRKKAYLILKFTKKFGATQSFSFNRRDV